MIEIKFTVEDENEAKLREFEEISPGILDAALRATARDFRNYVRRNYLRGQVFGSRSGKMQEDMHYGKSRRATHAFEVSGGPRILNIYSHSGGANIRPIHATIIKRQSYDRVNSKGKTVTGWKRKRRVTTERTGFIRFPNVTGNPSFGEYVFLRSAHLPERHVMEPAAQSFPFDSAFKAAADKLIDKAIKKRFKEVTSGV
jgi:hypothetical protein